MRTARILLTLGVAISAAGCNPPPVPPATAPATAPHALAYAVKVSIPLAGATAETVDASIRAPFERAALAAPNVRGILSVSRDDLFEGYVAVAPGASPAQIRKAILVRLDPKLLPATAGRVSADAVATQPGSIRPAEAQAVIVTLDRDKISALGLTIAQVQAQISKLFPTSPQIEPSQAPAIAAAPIKTKDGKTVPLHNIAGIRISPRPVCIVSERRLD